jgi:hypothetical protein
MGTSLNPPTSVKKRARFSVNRLTMYIAIVMLSVCATFIYKFRTDTIFACPIGGYTTDTYLAYCNARNYADYEHAAFAFDLEPAAVNFARNAQVLFLGNSHMQVALSTAVTSDWFSAASIRYYLMGFSYGENMVFAEFLLPKVRPRATIYVINVDDFFVRWESSPTKEILHDPEARHQAEDKRFWQLVHQRACGIVPALCGNDLVIFRSRETGAFTKRTAVMKTAPVSYDEVEDQDRVKSSTANAIEFMTHLPKQEKCVILTTVPTVETKVAEAATIARGVGLDLVTPGNLEGLNTYDGSHLDRPSAERWARAFLQVAGPRILSCLKEQATVQK